MVQRGWNDGPARMNYTSVQMLQDVLSKMAKKITINIEINNLDEKGIAILEDITVRHIGKHNLHFIVYDLEKKLKLNMPSRTKKVHISSELLKEMDKHKIYYKLN